MEKVQPEWAAPFFSFDWGSGRVEKIRHGGTNN